MPTLSDILPARPRLLMVGINPSLRSAELGHHFAGRGNPFWRLMHEGGLVPVPLTYADDTEAARFGIGLTNLCARATRSAAELTAAERAEGKRILTRKVARLRPRVVAFVGLTVYSSVFGHRTSGGAGPKPERLSGARLFALPNPSGLNASFPGFTDKLVWFRKLSAFVGNG